LSKDRLCPPDLKALPGTEIRHWNGEIRQRILEGCEHTFNGNAKVPNFNLTHRATAGSKLLVESDETGDIHNVKA